MKTIVEMSQPITDYEKLLAKYGITPEDVAELKSAESAANRASRLKRKVIDTYKQEERKKLCDFYDKVRTSSGIILDVMPAVTNVKRLHCNCCGQDKITTEPCLLIIFATRDPATGSRTRASVLQDRLNMPIMEIVSYFKETGLLPKHMLK